MHWFMQIILCLYAMMSIVTFIAYGIDKNRARKGRWRIAEMHLHLMELGFGWPGGLLGQMIFRHKTVKLSYRLVFVIIVVLHAIGWAMWFYSRRFT